MEITDLIAPLLIRLELQDKLTPLREIDYQDIRIGDILVNSPDYYDEWTAVQITGKMKDMEAVRWAFGEELLIYDIYHIRDDEVALEITGHRFPYSGLIKERWKRLKPAPSTIIALNHPRKPLNSRKDN